MNGDLTGDCMDMAAVISPFSPSSNQEMCMLSSSWGNDQAKNNSLPHPPLALSWAHIQMLKLQFLWWCPRARAREDSWFLITISPGCSSVLSLIRQVSFGHSPGIRTSLQLSLQSLAKQPGIGSYSPGKAFCPQIIKNAQSMLVMLKFFSWPHSFLFWIYMVSQLPSGSNQALCMKDMDLVYMWDWHAAQLSCDWVTNYSDLFVLILA